MAEQHLQPEQRDELERRRRESTDIGTGLGGGVSPVLPTDIDGENPDTDWLASSDKDTVVPNWTREQPVEGGSEHPGFSGHSPTQSERATVLLNRDAKLVSVFGEDLGEIAEVYGYTSDDPQWAAIKSGDRKVMVPVMAASLDDDVLQVPYPKNLIESAPEYPDEGISFAEEMAFYRHYNERRMLPEGVDSERTLLHPLRSAA